MQSAAAKKQADGPKKKQAPRRKLVECAEDVTPERAADATSLADASYPGTADQIGHAMGPLMAPFAECSTDPSAVLSGAVDAVSALPK